MSRHASTRKTALLFVPIRAVRGRGSGPPRDVAEPALHASVAFDVARTRSGSVTGIGPGEQAGKVAASASRVDGSKRSPMLTLRRFFSASRILRRQLSTLAGHRLVGESFCKRSVTQPPAC
jgi:hypothetical protein